MADSSDPISNINLRPLSVIFIDNHLQEYHESLKNSQARYDPALKRYVAMAPAAVMQPNSPTKLAVEMPLQGRKLRPAVEAMKFWTHIFEDSMKTFIEKYEKEPKHRNKKGYDYSIRRQKNWEDIYAQLQKAREAYDGKKGFWGRVKKGYRQVADQSDTTRQLTKLIPDNEYVSPVLAVVEVLVDAIQKGAEVRQEVTKKFDETTLETAFGNVEIFFSIFPKDEPIKEASIELVISTFKAIEDAISFFISKQIERAASVLWNGDGYQKDLLESLNDIDSKCRALIEEAQTSHIDSNSQAMKAILTRTGNISLKLDTIDGSIEYVVEKIDFIFGVGNKILESQDLVLQNQGRSKDQHAEHDAFMKNCFERLFSDYEKQAEELRHIKENQEHQNALLKKQHDEIDKLHHQIVFERERTPSPFQHQSQRPQLHPQQPQQPQQPYSSNHLQPMWQPTPQRPYSPWLPSQAQPKNEFYTELSILRDSLKIPDLDFADIKSIIDYRMMFPLELRSRSEQVVTTSQFKKFLTLPTSRKLLVHGDFANGSNYISPLSLLCATLTQALRKRDKYISLVFFCGSHIESDEGPVGGKAMIRSFIAQLLHQHDFGPLPLNEELDLNGIKKGNAKALRTLFSWLVKRLPEDITLVILLDGISHYEIDEDGFEDVMLRVVRLLLKLVRDGTDDGPNVKLLVTSPVRTDEVFDAFESNADGEEEYDDCFVDMAELPVSAPQFGMLSLESEVDPQNSEDSEYSEDADDKA